VHFHWGVGHPRGSAPPWCWLQYMWLHSSLAKRGNMSVCVCVIGCQPACHYGGRWGSLTGQAGGAICCRFSSYFTVPCEPHPVPPAFEALDCTGMHVHLLCLWTVGIPNTSRAGMLSAAHEPTPPCHLPLLECRCMAVGGSSGAVAAS